AVGEGVVALAGEELVVTRAAVESVVADAAEKLVAPGPADQGVVAEFAEQEAWEVNRGADGDDVVAVAAGHADGADLVGREGLSDAGDSDLAVAEADADVIGGAIAQDAEHAVEQRGCGRGNGPVLKSGQRKT